jgi:hypothetical protein
MRIKMTVNVLIQVLALVCQLLNGLSDVVSPDKKPYIGLAIMAGQGIVAILAHRSNPDGTSVQLPYLRNREATRNEAIIGLKESEKQQDDPH